MECHSNAIKLNTGGIQNTENTQHWCQQELRQCTKLQNHPLSCIVQQYRQRNNKQAKADSFAQAHQGMWLMHPCDIQRAFLVPRETCITIRLSPLTRKHSLSCPQMITNEKGQNNKHRNHRPTATNLPRIARAGGKKTTEIAIKKSEIRIRSSKTKKIFVSGVAMPDWFTQVAAHGWVRETGKAPSLGRSQFGEWVLVAISRTRGCSRAWWPSCLSRHGCPGCAASWRHSRSDPSESTWAGKGEQSRAANTSTIDWHKLCNVRVPFGYLATARAAGLGKPWL